jgi:3-isopropylmalate/(R)-2-methylmalate dehydratase small subunit
MKPFTAVTGVAAPLPRANVDTDQIMPKQFLKGVDRNGLGDGFLFDMRFAAPGVPRPEFILNQAPWTRAAFLVVGPNYGCGSSREHAVWGMMQIGIRAVIGTQFGGIFYDNCLRNGVPAILLPEPDVERLMTLASDGARSEITVDLPAQVIVASATGERIGFAFDPVHKDMLVRGISAVDATLGRADAIRAFEGAYYAGNPWLAS